MKQITIHHAAEKELWAAVDYYEGRVSGLGLIFEQEARRALATIQEAPLRWPQKAHGTRRYLMHRFPYSVYYVDFPETIWVVAFAHARRKPDYWARRK